MADTLTESTASVPVPAPRSRATRAATELGWSVEESASLYSIRNWGKGFFDVNAAGHVVVHPQRNPAIAVDLYEVVAGMRERGFRTPLLIHFSDLLKQRLVDEGPGGGGEELVGACSPATTTRACWTRAPWWTRAPAAARRRGVGRCM